MSSLNRTNPPKSHVHPTPPATATDGHLTGRILRDLFGGKPVTSVEFKGERIFFTHEIGAHLGYNDSRILTDNLKAKWADEMKAGTHFLKIEGDDLKALKALFADPKLSSETLDSSTNPDADDIRELNDNPSFSSTKPDGIHFIHPFARSLIVLTPTGLRRACVLCGTKEGVAFRDWLDTVLDKLDATGTYTLPPDPRAQTRSPDKRAPLTQEEREAREAARIEREKRANAKLLLKHLPQLREGAPHLSDASYQTFHVKTLELATGNLLPLRQFLPVMEEPRWYSPSELAREWGVTSQRIGLAVTAAGERLGLDLRADGRYSRCILNQATTSARQVPSYLYNDAGRALILEELRCGGHLPSGGHSPHAPTSHTHDGHHPSGGHNPSGGHTSNAPKRLASPDLSPTRAEAPTRRPHTHTHTPPLVIFDVDHAAQGDRHGAQGDLLPQSPARPTRPRLGDNTLLQGGDDHQAHRERRTDWMHEGRLVGYTGQCIMVHAASPREGIGWVPNMAPVRGEVLVVRRHDTNVWAGWAGLTAKRAALRKMREVLDLDAPTSPDTLNMTHEGLMLHVGVYEVLVGGVTHFLVTLPDARALRLLWAVDAGEAERATRCAMLGVMVLPQEASAKVAQMSATPAAYPLPHVAVLPLGSLLADWAGDDAPNPNDDRSPAHIKARLMGLLRELERSEVF